MVEHYDVPPDTCPECGRDLNCATSAPRPGDFTICIGCTACLRFTEELTVRRTLPSELAELSPEAIALLEKARQKIRALGIVNRRARN